MEVFGLANNPLVTEWEYWGKSDITGAGSSTNGQALLKKVTYPDGKVVNREYKKTGSDPNPTYTHNTSSQSTGTGFSLFGEVSTMASGESTSTQMSEGSSIFSQTSTTWSGNTATNRRYSGPSLFEESATTVESFGNDFGGRPTASIFADGTASETTHTRDGSIRTSTSTFGETDGNGNIVDGTETTTSANKDGVVSLRTEKDVASNVITKGSRVPTGQTDPIGRPLKIEHQMDSNDNLAYWGAGCRQFESGRPDSL